jgi:hypothetical protein
VHFRDDVVTSGGQTSDAMRALKAADAADRRFAAVAWATAAPEDAAACAITQVCGPHREEPGHSATDVGLGVSYRRP